MLYPKFTIIIPTLQRAETLKSTISTALNQQYPHYSIIVSDNVSNDNTREVVEAFNSDKITYINPGKRLSMSHHWEFALTHVQEGYVTILGDDDGLLPNALQKVADILGKHPLPAIGWRFGNFNWAGLPVNFSIPMANYYRVVDAPTEINHVFKQNIYNTIQFPSLYGGFISIDLIKQLKAETGGQFFHSRIPDFFSGAMVAASVPQYIRLEFPITINATSKHSTGFSAINKDSKNQSSFTHLQKGDDNIPFHPSLIFIRSNVVPISEALLQVHELRPNFPKVDFKKMLATVANEAASAKTIEEFDSLIEGIKEIAALNGLESYADELFQGLAHHPAGEHVIRKKFSPLSITLYVDTTNTGIDTVEDACQFANSVVANSCTQLPFGLAKHYFRLTAMLRYYYAKYCSKNKAYL